MTQQLTLPAQTLAHLRDLAHRLAPYLRKGDVITLSGELGAGKTALARLIIQALSGEETAVTSPSFALMQTYETPRLNVAHFDFYRIAGPEEASEIGLEEALSDALSLIEWPERVADLLPPDRLEIILEETGDPQTRNVTLRAFGDWQPRLERIAATRFFLERAGWGDARCQALSGDASARAYLRLTRAQAAGEPRSALLMDWPPAPDGPPLKNGLPYSRIAHLAEEAQPYLAIAELLRGIGLAAPKIYAQDTARGLLVIEDFGDHVLSREALAGRDMAEPYRVAAQALLRLRHLKLPPPPAWRPHLFDHSALHIETELLLDWYLPGLLASPPTGESRAQFHALWQAAFNWLDGEPRGLTVRDFHSPNLIWREGETGLARLGIIDFQDAVIGHPAYDLVSLLQDARTDIPPALEAELLRFYCTEAAREDLSFDEARFRRAYALLGAQRATKILGIFARLALRDDKRAYLRHIPRVRSYLTRNLAHPALAPLKTWYGAYLPKWVDATAPDKDIQPALRRA